MWSRPVASGGCSTSPGMAAQAHPRHDLARPFGTYALAVLRGWGAHIAGYALPDSGESLGEREQNAGYGRVAEGCFGLRECSDLPVGLGFAGAVVFAGASVDGVVSFAASGGVVARLAFDRFVLKRKVA